MEQPIFEGMCAKGRLGRKFKSSVARTFVHNIRTFDSPTYFGPTPTRCEVPPTTDNLQFLYKRSSVSISAARVLTASHRGTYCFLSDVLIAVQPGSCREMTFLYLLLNGTLNSKRATSDCDVSPKKACNFCCLHYPGENYRIPYLSKGLIYGERPCPCQMSLFSTSLITNLARV